jgi:Sulfatase
MSTSTNKSIAVADTSSSNPANNRPIPPHKTFKPFHILIGWILLVGLFSIHRYTRINLQQYLPTATNVADERLNIVLFYADDWTFHTLGAMGNSYVQTPHLDQLAKEGMLFTHNCVVTSVCMQSRATLYTGQYSSVHQSFFCWRNITMYEDGKWNQTLYPIMLRQGYHVGFFGKYHHLEPPPGPTFSEWSSTRMSHFVNCHGEQKHVTQCNEDDGISFLAHRPKDKPFFLTLSFFATHAEFLVSIFDIPCPNSRNGFDNLVDESDDDDYQNIVPAEEVGVAVGSVDPAVTLSSSYTYNIYLLHCTWNFPL